jgi:hypothetical protein
MRKAVRDRCPRHAHAGRNVDGEVMVVTRRYGHGDASLRVSHPHGTRGARPELPLCVRARSVRDHPMAVEQGELAVDVAGVGSVGRAALSGYPVVVMGVVISLVMLAVNARGLAVRSRRPAMHTIAVSGRRGLRWRCRRSAGRASYCDAPALGGLTNCRPNEESVT